ncbi:MAG: NADP-dependent phosphogluconate dehydrogenase [Deltaproteobacteria bacterium]|jgi:6-phosphogluconate dehydrogenase|nr:NADP-dependent phosphogluconate dehydrogenase [Deltaproteobacteria bacterium]
MMIKEIRKIGVVGLGRMGRRLSQRLKDQGYIVTGFDISDDNKNEFLNAGMDAVDSLKELCAKFDSTRIIMILVPSGSAVDKTIDGLIQYLNKEDIVLDCGNSLYTDSIARANKLKKTNVHFLDVGTSGGVSGARNGPCLTIGGSKDVYESIQYFFQDLAQENGYYYIGPAGWGHMVKIIHNGIEYGILQAIGEGLNLIKKVADKKNVEIDISQICDVWCNGSIIESRLMHDAVTAMDMLSKNQDLIEGKIGGGETGKWAMEIAKKNDVPTPGLKASLEYREKTQLHPDYIGKIIAAIRNVFGMHELSAKKPDV